MGTIIYNHVIINFFPKLYYLANRYWTVRDDLLLKLFNNSASFYIPCDKIFQLELVIIGSICVQPMHLVLKKLSLTLRRHYSLIKKSYKFDTLEQWRFLVDLCLSWRGRYLKSRLWTPVTFTHVSTPWTVEPSLPARKVKSISTEIRCFTSLARVNYIIHIFNNDYVM